MKQLLLNKAHYPVTVLGPGKRVGIWVQGCSIGCYGCMSRDTWAADTSTAVELQTVMAWVSSLRGDIDGVTLSGGEPFQQAEAVAELLTLLDHWRQERSEEIDFLVYSGYTMRALERRRDAQRVLGLADAVIAGPYVERRNTGVRWRGSDNQEIVPLSPLGQERYARVEHGEPEMQFSVEDGRVYYIGTPRAGDMERIESTLQEAGVKGGSVSWRG